MLEFIREAIWAQLFFLRKFFSNQCLIYYRSILIFYLLFVSILVFCIFLRICQYFLDYLIYWNTIVCSISFKVGSKIPFSSLIIVTESFRPFYFGQSTYSFVSFLFKQSMFVVICFLCCFSVLNFIYYCSNLYNFLSSVCLDF